LPPIESGAPSIALVQQIACVRPKPRTLRWGVSERQYSGREPRRVPGGDYATALTVQNLSGNITRAIAYIDHRASRSQHTIVLAWYDQALERRPQADEMDVTDRERLAQACARLRWLEQHISQRLLLDALADPGCRWPSTDE
jgi:hypothetical protein